MTITTPGTGLAPIYVGRVIAGLAIGGASMVTPIFISEIAPPSIRGQLVGIYELGWQIGGLVSTLIEDVQLESHPQSHLSFFLPSQIGFWLPYGVNTTMAPSVTQWRIPFAIQLLPGGLFTLGALLFLVESPRWLISRGRNDEALKILCYIRQLDAEEPYIVDEIASMRDQFAQEVSVVGTDWVSSFFQESSLVSICFPNSPLFLLLNSTPNSVGHSRLPLVRGRLSGDSSSVLLSSLSNLLPVSKPSTTTVLPSSSLSVLEPTRLFYLLVSSVSSRLSVLSFGFST